MKTIVPFLFLGAAILALSGCNATITSQGYYFTNTGVEAMASEEGTFDEGITNLRIENRHGSVKIRPADGEAKWSWHKKVWGDTEEVAKVLLDELYLESTSENGQQTIKIVLPEPTSDLNGVESNLTLWIPEAVAVAVRNDHGNVDAANIKEASEFEVRHGKTELQSMGDLTLKASHGDIKPTNVGQVKVSTGHGNVSIYGVDDAQVQTNHGNIKLGDLSENANVDCDHGSIRIENLAGNLEARGSHCNIVATVDGEVAEIRGSHMEIAIEMTNEAFQSVEAKTSHDNITIKLPASSTPNLELNTSHGNVRSDFETDETSGQKVVLKNSHGDIRVSGN